MPYITQDDRQSYDEKLDDLCLTLDEEGWQPGHVTYVLYMIVARLFKKLPSYHSICHIRGCLIGTLAEFDRCLAAPYEDLKIRENGNVNLKYTTMEFDKPVEQDPLGFEEHEEGCPHYCSSPANCEVCRDAPVEVEPEEGDPDFDECTCGRELLGVHSTNIHNGGA